MAKGHIPISRCQLINGFFIEQNRALVLFLKAGNDPLLVELFVRALGQRPEARVIPHVVKFRQQGQVAQWERLAHFESLFQVIDGSIEIPCNGPVFRLDPL